MLVTLKAPPGLYKNGTNYQSMGRFYEADLWRWFEGTQRPIGGWRAKSETVLAGKARACLTWRDNGNAVWIAVGTHSKLYAVTRGGAVTDITPSGMAAGAESATTGGGYGRGYYGQGFYGAPTPDTTNVIPAAMWTLDTYGENLIGAFGGTIYEWAPDTEEVAIPLENAPEAEAVLVTEENAIMALGTTDPRRIQWSDLEDNTDWTPAPDNEAGGKRLVTGGKIQCGKRIPGGGLVFTDTDVHRFEYTGAPLYYAFERLGTGCGVVSKGAAVVIDGRALWMGSNGFWEYNGVVSPLQSDLSEWLFRNMNTLQASKVSAMHNSAFGEVWWFYPSKNSTECDRAVIYCYKEGHWNDTAFDRTCGADRGVLPNPIMVSNLVYEHETGQTRGRQPYALCGPIEIGKGDRTMEVGAYIPDGLALGHVEVSFAAGDWTMSDTEVFGPYPASDKTDVRFSARRVSPKFIAALDKDFRVGDFRFDVRQGSRR